MIIRIESSNQGLKFHINTSSYILLFLRIKEIYLNCLIRLIIHTIIDNYCMHCDNIKYQQKEKKKEKILREIKYH